jgi:hypothetical protein
MDDEQWAADRHKELLNTLRETIPGITPEAAEKLCAKLELMIDVKIGEALAH